MSFTLVDFAKLKEGVNQSIISEVRSYHPKRPIDPEKILAAILLLRNDFRVNPQRYIQTHFLFIVGSMLADEKCTFDNPKKQMILNAAVFYIYKKIKKEYDDGVVAKLTPSFISSAEGSVLCTCLKHALGIEKNNKPSSIEIKNMYSELKSFLSFNLYRDGTPESGYLDPDSQPFSSIIGYDIKADIDYLRGKIFELETNLSQEAAVLDKKANRPESSTGIFGWFASGNKSTPVSVPNPESSPEPLVSKI